VLEVVAECNIGTLYPVVGDGGEVELVRRTGPYALRRPPGLGQECTQMRKCAASSTDWRTTSELDAGTWARPWPTTRWTSMTIWSAHGTSRPTTCAPGRMRRGPQGVFAKVPGLDAAYRALTRVVPLRRGQVVEPDGRLFVR